MEDSNELNDEADDEGFRAIPVFGAVVEYGGYA